MLMMRKDEMDPTEITPHLCLVHVVCKIIFFFYTHVSANAYQRITWPIQIHCWIQGQSLYLSTIFFLKKKPNKFQTAVSLSPKGENSLKLPSTYHIESRMFLNSQ